ncbi:MULTISPECIES: 16S rRNA (cytidine(1402)-2'-O)-methyltransferase [Myxococcus]|uniref:Ribosomal RNA small subunit methyltransferase I n=2 Tax=Myxococcus TaxID=32 RepID=Q1D6H8_MYXXD|nr:MULTISPECIES: 16S rRNA (cytidine(1402)-2'-O)-methyltransferase [Myxococcus]ABF89581.1 tetrapyrrole methylase family protein [Myxococcus xanthus DK 1622]NOJ56079.1 16S rRNA (cytidine(1402)-2'-O)-methyltransferase [Myxococcus xanthus]NOK04436.1 16S rRNA (cytidine(1402)-2'-O)-methyltransferase [Myxococcus xanthus]QPM82966.1 16S rRNA (cytidine(1402)-2'-O)-methyltransferase [Myxococcus xanthus]QVW65272.1 16S rRNA (cytidine(1402)-2'-O)-methyltransferase [Myxococcus xanthus DZ2]
MAGTLYLVATPIGNLGDVTSRALETLRAVRFIACEDTRHSRVLLDHFGIGGKDLVSLPAFAEGQRAGRILDRIGEGEDCALVTDAGSPAISDPGEKLVAEALERGLTVVPVPGPTALVAALSASGLPTGRFHFLGFLPRKGAERRAMLEEVAQLSATLVLYESPRRLSETLPDLLDAWGDRRACVARELTKLHEEFARGTLSELAARYAAEEPRGEVVVLVEGRTGETRWSEEELRRALEEGLSRGEKLKALSTELARRAGWAGQDVYRLGLSLKR